jgi:hypothetical protein
MLKIGATSINDHILHIYRNKSIARIKKNLTLHPAWIRAKL